jgi:hypothetical protein
MASKVIFSEEQAVVRGLPTEKDQKTEVVAKLSVGGKVRNFILMGQLNVKQNDRIQVDAAADGTMHVVSCKGSVGYCDVQLLDRKVDCMGSSDFAIKCYTNEMKSLSSRKVELSLYPASGTVVTFSGVVTGADVSVQYDSRILYFMTTLHLMGSWD